jgi:hypothetical protein
MSSNVTVARGLQVGSDARALTFVELDARMSEVFRDKNILWSGGFIDKKALAMGAASERFYIYGGSSEDAEHHVAGQFIEGGTTTQDYVDIGVDDPLIKALRIPWADQQLSKWQIAEKDMAECVRINSEKLDRRGFRLLSLAARTGAVSGVHGGGHTRERVAASLAAAYPISSTGADNFAEDLSYIARSMDDANVPRTSRYAFISPYMNQVCTRSNRFTNRDYVPPGMNTIHDRAIGMVEGFQLILTNHLPSTNITNDLSKYNGDWSVGGATGQPAALCMYKGEAGGPIGAVHTGGMINRVVWDENRDVWMAKSKIMCGMGKYEVWQAGEVYVSTS